MKRVLIAASLGLALTGCDGDVIKSMARAVLADEINQNQQQAPQQQAQQPVATDPNAQLQPVQAVTTAPAQPTTQVQQPATTQVQTTPTQQQPTTIIVQAEQPQPQKTIVVKQEKKSNFAPTHYVETETDGYVFMRSHPDAAAKKIVKLNDYAEVQLINCTSDYTVRTDSAAAGDEGYWCKVRTQKGATGYVFDRYLKSL